MIWKCGKNWSQSSQYELPHHRVLIQHAYIMHVCWVRFAPQIDSSLWMDGAHQIYGADYKVGRVQLGDTKINIFCVKTTRNVSFPDEKLESFNENSSAKSWIQKWRGIKVFPPSLSNRVKGSKFFEGIFIVIRCPRRLASGIDQFLLHQISMFLVIPNLNSFINLFVIALPP